MLISSFRIVSRILRVRWCRDSMGFINRTYLRRKKLVPNLVPTTTPFPPTIPPSASNPSILLSTNPTKNTSQMNSNKLSKKEKSVSKQTFCRGFIRNYHMATINPCREGYKATKRSSTPICETSISGSRCRTLIISIRRMKLTEPI